MSGHWDVSISHDHVLVTGGGSGIGRAVTLALAKGGTNVTIFGRRQEWLDETARMADGMSGRVFPISCNIRDNDRLEEAFTEMEREGLATGLVNAAAQVSMMDARNLTVQEFSDVVSATLICGYAVVRRWGVALLDAGVKGAAVMITSSNASMGAPGLSHSSAGKAGTNALVKSLAKEWGPHGLTLNAVGPGPFPVEKSLAMWDNEAIKARFFKEVPLGRYGELPEIVGPIMFLLSSGGSFTTGQVITVDGGLSLQQWPMPPDEIANGQSVWSPGIAAS
jgi:NAD(P)-dependent dehydrogenase (short-subunit alcohol dehydrogenase family)